VNDIHRKIGLSLGADICWPACYEHIMRRLDLKVPTPEGTIRFDVERVTIEPFDLQQPVKYDVVVDRLTHWYHTSREWIKKGVVMNDLYVFNNPWSVQANEKHTSYAAMMALGMPIPGTWMVPPKGYAPNPDLKPTLSRYAKLFDLGNIGRELGYPLFMKPYDGGGWRAVTKCDDERALKRAYEESDTMVMHLQAGVNGFDRFVRCIGFGPQTYTVLYDPSAPLHDRYTREKGFISKSDEEHLRKITLTINAFFGWEFNSCESLRKDGVWYPIDFANPCPDSQVTSLHYHFPWLVKSYIRWSTFVARRRRRCGRTSTGSPSTRSQRSICPSRRSSIGTRRSPTSASRRPASRSGRRATSATSTRSRGSSSRARRPRRPSGRRSPRSSPHTRSSSSPSSSTTASSSGVRTTAPSGAEPLDVRGIRRLGSVRSAVRDRADNAPEVP
jgi:hypothetical protein